MSLGARGVWKPLPPALSAGGAGPPDVADLRADDRRVEHGAIETDACGGVLLHPLCNALTARVLVDLRPVRRALVLGVPVLTERVAI